MHVFVHTDQKQRLVYLVETRQVKRIQITEMKVRMLIPDIASD